MDKYRMCFFNRAEAPDVFSGPTIGLRSISKEAAIDMAEKIWMGLIEDDPAAGYCVLAPDSNKVVHLRAR